MASAVSLARSLNGCKFVPIGTPDVIFLIIFRLVHWSLMFSSENGLYLVLIYKYCQLQYHFIDDHYQKESQLFVCLFKSK